LDRSSKQNNKKLHEFYLSFEVITAVTMKTIVFWDVTPCNSCKSYVSEGGIASIFSIKRISEFGATLTVTSNCSTLQRTGQGVSCNGVSIVEFIHYRGYIVTGRCFVVDVIERYLYGRLPQWQSMMIRDIGENVKLPNY
jgi:hypothetical protein